MRNVMQAIQEHYQELLRQGIAPESILGVFCYGSQNYNFHDEYSDVDTKAIVIPTIAELCFKQPISREIHFENGEHCEVKDIREIVKMFCKQNLNFLEILFTPYHYINPDYKMFWDVYFTKRNERIAHYSQKQTIMSITGQAIHTLKQNPTNGKKYADGLRMFNFLTEYLRGRSYAEAMVVPGGAWREHVLCYKRGQLQPIEEESAILREKFSALREEWSNKEDVVDDDIEAFMNQGILHLIAVRNNLSPHLLFK